MGIRYVSRNGFKNVLILFLGLNIAWMETSVNAIIYGGPDKMLGWPPFDMNIPAIDWFWTHFTLTILITAILLYLEQLRKKA